METYTEPQGTVCNKFQLKKLDFTFDKIQIFKGVKIPANR